ncbi:MAG TPA: hypothetical protein VFX45_02060 [Solirubrobacterales bacterium]|nr:hypothetical protein [Solirubrobacterales bacterium]
MPPPEDPTQSTAVAQQLIEELLRSAFVLQDLMAVLIEELPDEAFPGEEKAEVVLEMVIGTSLPAVEAAGAETSRAATELIKAVLACVVNDLRTAATIGEAG